LGRGNFVEMVLGNKIGYGPSSASIGAPSSGIRHQPRQHVDNRVCNGEAAGRTFVSVDMSVVVVVDGVGF
jgi:hypothetical protein